MININNYIVEKLHIGKDINDDTPVYKKNEIVLEICASSKSNMLLFFVCEFRGYKNGKLTVFDILTKKEEHFEFAELNSYGFYESRPFYSAYLILPSKQAEEFISELLKYENKDLLKFPFENYFDNPINKETMNGALNIPKHSWPSVRDLQYRFKQLNK